MKKTLLILSILLSSSYSYAQYTIMGYYPTAAYGDYVIVYGYYQSNGVFTLSHCRTNFIGSDIYSDQFYLDVNTCQFRRRDDIGLTPPINPHIAR